MYKNKTHNKKASWSIVKNTTMYERNKKKCSHNIKSNKREYDQSNCSNQKANNRLQSQKLKVKEIKSVANFHAKENKHKSICVNIYSF